MAGGPARRGSGAARPCEAGAFGPGGGAYGADLHAHLYGRTLRVGRYRRDPRGVPGDDRFRPPAGHRSGGARLCLGADQRQGAHPARLCRLRRRFPAALAGPDRPGFRRLSQRGRHHHDRLRRHIGRIAGHEDADLRGGRLPVQGAGRCLRLRPFHADRRYAEHRNRARTAGGLARRALLPAPAGRTLPLRPQGRGCLGQSDAAGRGRFRLRDHAAGEWPAGTLPL